MDLRKIKRPTLLLDESICRDNIRTMADKAKLSGVVFRPHFKTHQSIEVGNWFREEGVKAITVSSVTMAKHFASAGWNDITIAFPINVREKDEIGKLSRTCNLNILISDIEQIEFLKDKSDAIAGYFIKTDTGYQRSGIDWNDHIQILRILEYIKINTGIRIKGFLTHSGHTYRAESKNAITEIYKDTLLKLSSLRDLSADNVILSTGDTPSCSIIEKFNGFDEIRPGNFVFYDLMQYYLGSCSFDRIAVTVACPVVEKNIKRREIIFYGGGVHLSKESIKVQGGQTIYGKAVLFENNSIVRLSDSDFVRSLSQEHGIISSSDELFSNLKVGDLVGIIPVHSCLTADLLRQYHTFDGKIISDLSPK